MNSAPATALVCLLRRAALPPCAGSSTVSRRPSERSARSVEPGVGHFSDARHSWHNLTLRLYSLARHHQRFVVFVVPSVRRFLTFAQILPACTPTTLTLARPAHSGSVAVSVVCRDVCEVWLLRQPLSCSPCHFQCHCYVLLHSSAVARRHGGRGPQGKERLHSRSSSLGLTHATVAQFREYLEAHGYDTAQMGLVGDTDTMSTDSDEKKMPA